MNITRLILAARDVGHTDEDIAKYLDMDVADVARVKAKPASEQSFAGHHTPDTSGRGRKDMAKPGRRCETCGGRLALGAVECLACKIRPKLG